MRLIPVRREFLSDFYQISHRSVSLVVPRTLLRLNVHFPYFLSSKSSNIGSLRIIMESRLKSAILNASRCAYARAFSCYLYTYRGCTACNGSDTRSYDSCTRMRAIGGRNFYGRTRGERDFWAHNGHA